MHFDVSPNTLFDFRRLADQLPHIVWTQRPDGSFDFANRRWYEYTGLPEDVGLSAAGWAAIVPPADFVRVLPLQDEALRSGRPYEAVHRIKPLGAGDEAYRWHQVRSMPVRDDAGELLGWVGTATDIHERKSGDDALRESEEFLRRILASTEDCIKVLDLDGRLLFLSENGCDAMDIASFEPLRNSDWLEFWEGDDRAAARAAVAAARAGRPGEFEGFCATMAGTPKWWHVVVTPMLGPSGMPERLLVVSRDVSGAHRSRELVERSTAMYRGLAEAVPAMVFSAGPDGGLDYVNQRWIDYTGMTFEQSLGFTWAPLVHPDDAAATAALWFAAVAAAREHEAAYRLRRVDGAYRWHVTRAVPVKDAGGAIVRWFGSTVDIDDSKRSAERLAFLVDAGKVLGRSLELDETLDALLGLVVPAMGDWAVINLREADGRLRAVAVRHADPAAAAQAAGLRGAYYWNEHAQTGTGNVVRTGVPLIVPSVDDAYVASAVKPEARSMVAALGLRSALIVPLVSRGRTIGALSSAWATDAHAYENADLPLFEDLASRAAVAIEHAQLYAREHDVATALQQAALPRSLPAVAGVTFDAVYQPGKLEAQIGGDWYDAFALPDGRIVLSIGDVLGSGLVAAVAMTKLRQAIRTAALADPDPAAILHVADIALKLDDPDNLATALVGLFDPRTRTLTCAAAGHPGPLLRTAGGTIVEPFLVRDLPLGLRTGERAFSHTITLAAGSFLVFYTDGLIESTRDALEGERRLRAALADPAILNAPRPAGALYDAVLFDGAHDDVAVLTLLQH